MVIMSEDILVRESGLVTMEGPALLTVTLPSV